MNTIIKIVFFSLIFFSFSPTLFSADENQLNNNLYTLSAGFTYYESGINIDTSDAKKAEVMYNTNIPLLYQLTFSYNDIGFSLSKSSSDPSKDEKKFGKTDFFGIRLFEYGKSYIFDCFYYSFKGLYQEKPQLEIRDDISLKDYSINLTYRVYSIDSDHSYKNAYSKTELQKDWGLSFNVMTSLFRHDINADYTIIPTESNSLYYSKAGFESGKYYGINLLPGIIATGDFDLFYSTASMNLGLGYMKNYDYYNDKEIESNSIYFKMIAHIIIGKNFSNFFTNFEWLVEFDSYGEDTFMTSMISSINLTAGCTF